jgi:hypothetical protein
MLLCTDIDFSAPQNGVAQPGARLIAQVFAKKLSRGAVAVLFLNADTNKTQDLSVDLAELFADASAGDHIGALTVRDVWQKADAGSVAGAAGNFTVHAIPPQDSKLMIFTPAKQHDMQVPRAALAAGLSVSLASL